MATDKQIEANRRNALKSTGPKTDETKQVSKANAWKHGLAATTMLFCPGRHEDAAAFHEMRNDLIRILAARRHEGTPAGRDDRRRLRQNAASRKHRVRIHGWCSRLLVET